MSEYRCQVDSAMTPLAVVVTIIGAAIAVGIAATNEMAAKNFLVNMRSPNGGEKEY
jgi:hypothetical protein